MPPGITRLLHFIRVKNLLYSIDDVRQVVDKCKVCSELKPRFYKPPIAHIVKATEPFERISIDFKGPLPSSTKNCFILTVVDEFSRFPFAFPCASCDAKTVISCLKQLFTLFDMPGYVHSDRGPAFMSQELIAFLNSCGTACSKTSVYNAPGNGQCERYNDVVWNAIMLALKSCNLDIRNWQDVMNDALLFIRSLLCTATNVSPHERFLSISEGQPLASLLPPGYVHRALSI